VNIDNQICLPQQGQGLPRSNGIIAGWGQINSLIDFLNQYVKIDVEQIDLKGSRA
jgi:hypothetical protein